MSAPLLHSLLRETPIVVTGMGAFSAAGRNVDELWSTACASQSRARRLTVHPSPDGQLFPGYSAPAVHLPERMNRWTRRMDRCVHLALAAATEAWKASQSGSNSVSPTRIGVAVGTSRGPGDKWTQSVHLLQKGRMLPTLAANTTIASLSGALSVAFGTRGPALTVSAACASSAAALAFGAEQILLGSADVMLVGGAEASLQPVILSQLEAAGVLARHEIAAQACRPFDATRNGTVLGEGAAFLILESQRSVRQRGAKGLARFTGWAIGSEGAERTGISESGTGLSEVVSRALANAGLRPRQIDYLNLHGTGTVLNDRTEAESMRQVFGETPLCSSTKAITGHCMGAAAAIEAVVSILALQHQCGPPNANCSQPDKGAPASLILGAALPARLNTVMSNSSGFWGNHASLIFQGMQP